jgi:hypothetical protein
MLSVKSRCHLLTMFPHYRHSFRSLLSLRRVTKRGHLCRACVFCPGGLPPSCRPTRSYPETGFGGIAPFAPYLGSTDVLEADFELGTRQFAVIQKKGGRQLAFQMKIVPRRGVQRLGSLLDELICHP